MYDDIITSESCNVVLLMVDLYRDIYNIFSLLNIISMNNNNGLFIYTSKTVYVVYDNNILTFDILYLLAIYIYILLKKLGEHLTNISNNLFIQK